MQISNIFAGNILIFVLAEPILITLKFISYNRNEQKQSISTWLITEVSNSVKRYAVNSQNHADLSALKML